MSEPIKVGDLVVVVRACCMTAEKWVGITFTAAPPNARYQPWSNCCGRKTPGRGFAENTQAGANWSEWFLKRIPPLSELEGEKRREEIEA